MGLLKGPEATRPISCSIKLDYTIAMVNAFLWSRHNRDVVHIFGDLNHRDLDQTYYLKKADNYISAQVDVSDARKCVWLYWYTNHIVLLSSDFILECTRLWKSAAERLTALSSPVQDVLDQNTSPKTIRSLTVISIKILLPSTVVLASDHLCFQQLQLHKACRVSFLDGITNN